MKIWIDRWPNGDGLMDGLMKEWMDGRMDE